MYVVVREGRVRKLYPVRVLTRTECMALISLADNTKKPVSWSDWENDDGRVWVPVGWVVKDESDEWSDEDDDV